VSFVLCEKRQSVLRAGGHCLVMGGPGSGKTTLALMKATQRLKDGLLPGQSVLFLSFSRAAVARIADAAKRQLTLDEKAALSIQTFHSFFWQILQGHGYLLGSPRAISIVLAHDDKAMREGIERESPAWEAWEAARLEMFRAQGRVCFDLFAPLTADILAHAKAVRNRVSRRYPLVLVDEAQDTSSEQWACLRMLAEQSQVICLADPDQMIYDFLPGVGPARISEIRAALAPLEINLGTENNRSPDNEILAFARDILRNRVKGSGYRGVTRQGFRSSVEERDYAIRGSIETISEKIRHETGYAPDSIALIASYGAGVAIISSALQKEEPISHSVLFDEAFALLASRAAAFLLEPKELGRNAQDIATLLELIGAAFRAKGNQTALKVAARCVVYAGRCRRGDVPNYNIVRAAAALVEAARGRVLTGDPGRDWVNIKQDMRQIDERSFVEAATALDYLVAFARGHTIRDSLSETWMQHGAYVGAREVLDSAFTQEQLLSASEELHGIHVMNMHKCKGKQFDAVVLYRQEHHSPFVWHNEAAPYTKSRRLLHMAITRAKSHVLILDEQRSACPIIDRHAL
jgi:DNA helicase-2/ATP-dependent DNA helicase PcrA